MNSKWIYFLLIIFIIPSGTIAQSIAGKELVRKSIAYHDANNQWPAFKGDLHLISQTPDKPDRIRDLHFDNKKQFFRVDFVGEDAYSYIVNGEDASIIYKGKKEIPEAAKEKYKLSKERAKMYRNYFVYLYGMPMKILDPGAHIHDKVERVEFYGMDVLKLKVTYDEAVGKDIWYFYFDPTTFALKAYQFFHDESKNDGEYILFEDEVIEDGIRFPATRKWYYNKDGGFLGADVLKGE